MYILSNVLELGWVRFWEHPMAQVKYMTTMAKARLNDGI